MSNSVSKVISLFCFSLLVVISFPLTALAVPPPDFLFNIGAQIAQFFSIAVLFLSAVFSVSYKYIQVKLALMKSKKGLFIGISFVVIIGISILIAYIYGSYKQNNEYENWVAESKEYENLVEDQKNYEQNTSPETLIIANNKESSSTERSTTTIETETSTVNDHRTEVRWLWICRLNRRQGGLWF